MTDLSPAAQAVLDVLHDSHDDSPTELVAAALRAAALQLSKLWSAEECMEALQAMADELEGTT